MAVVEHRDAIAVLGQQRDLLLDDNDGHILRLVDVAQGVEHEMRRGRVERRRGLVEHEHARAQCQDRRDGNLLLLAARESRDLALAQVGDANGLERLGHAGLDLVVRNAEVLEAEEHLVLDHRRHHLRIDVLQHAAHEARDVGERDVAGVLAIHEHGAKELTREVVRDGAAHHAGQRGLSRARRADDAHEVALAHRQGHVVERAGGALVGVAIGKRDVSQLDDGRARRAHVRIRHDEPSWSKLVRPHPPDALRASDARPGRMQAKAPRSGRTRGRHGCGHHARHRAQRRS